MPRGKNNDGSPNPGWFQKGSSPVFTPEHRKKIGEAQKLSWRTDNRRRPIGSTWVDRDGYVRVKVSEPCAYWIPQHILVAQQNLGRDLEPEEVVHHIDVVPGNNDWTNLHVFPSKREHNEAHRSLHDLVSGLLADGIIYFDRISGSYKRCR